MSSAREMRGAAHLSPVTDPIPGITTESVTVQPAWAARRPAVLRICGGEALILEDHEVDFVDLANAADQIDDLLLDDAADPDTYSPAEVAVEHFCYWYGLDRHGKGDRVKGVESNYRRYLVRFLVEMEAARPPARPGVAQFRIRVLATLPRVLPGDPLGRRRIACLYLAPADAARVTIGGLRA